MKGQQPQINCLIPSHTCFKPIRLGISCGYKNTSYFPRHKKKHISQKAANTRKILVSLHKCAHWSITFWETRRSSSYFLVYEVALCSVCTTWGEIPIRWCKKNSSIKFSLSTISRFQYIKLLRLLLNIREEEHVFQSTGLLYKRKFSYKNRAKRGSFCVHCFWLPFPYFVRNIHHQSKQAFLHAFGISRVLTLLNQHLPANHR